MLRKLQSFFSPEKKSFAAQPIIAMQTIGRPQWSQRDFATMVKQGFSNNAIGYRAVRMIAEAASSVPLLIYQGDKEQLQHPMKALLDHPNPAQKGRVFIENIVSYLLVAGNSYIEASSIDGTPRELVSLRPDRMRPIPGARGWIDEYEYSVYGQITRLAAENILHLKLFNPLDDYYGMSPFEGAARAVDTHNAATGWNKAMLDNAARPSGALVFSGGDGTMSQEQFSRLKSELEENFQGAANAGRPMVLEGGLDWKEMGYSPKDMDFIAAKDSAAREIALAFGVPPMLLGIPGDNTYANYAEANRTFWRQTVIPTLGRVTEALSGFIGPAFGENLRIDFDLDRVEALAPDRDALWKRLNDATFLTTAEKRQAVGYGNTPAP